MKYTILEDFKKYLITCGLRPNTVRSYYNQIDRLLDGQYFINDTENIDFTKVINNMADINYKNHFSQSKNSLLYFLDCFQISLDNEQFKMMDEFQIKTTRKTRTKNEIEYKKIKRTIARLKNKKLKLSFLTIIETGLRVFELSQICKKDCVIDKDTVQFSFIGKGGLIESDRVNKADNLTLYNELKRTISLLSDDNEKLFYSANYLQQKAKYYGFTCHDLRRISAKLEYRKTKSKKLVKQKLRHTKIKTTNIYLNSPIKLN